MRCSLPTLVDIGRALPHVRLLLRPYVEMTKEERAWYPVGERQKGDTVNNLFARAFALLPILMTPAAHAQVTVDVSRITCEQFIVLPKADSVAIWLSGYYHGDHRDPIIDVNKFEETGRDLRAACRQPENFKRPIMQLIEASRPK